MKIEEAIRWLEKLKHQHGPETPVYFDCPSCQIAYTPSTLAAKAIVISKGADK